jgi:hypothetical protein
MLNKMGVSRTECGLEVEEAIVKELMLRDFLKTLPARS